MTGITTCFSCKCELVDSSDIKFCDCLFNFCTNCYNEHSSDIKLLYPHLSEEIPKCPQHDEEYNYFCHEANCKQVVCHGCGTDFHKGHMIYDLSARRRDIVKEISVSKEKCNEKLAEVGNSISEMNNRKASFQREVNGLQTMIQEKCDDLVKFVRRTFEDQIENLNQNRDEELEKMSKMLKSLRKFEYDIRKIFLINHHFPIAASDFKVNTYYQKYDEFVAKVGLEKVQTSFDAKKLTVMSNICDYLEVQGHIRDFAGEVTLIYETICSRGSQEVALPDSVYDTRKDEIVDICYDDSIECLLLLLNRYRRYYIKIITQTLDDSELKVDVKLSDKCLSIILLGSSSILLFYESNVKLITLDFRRFYVGLPKEIQDLENVMAICSSPCKRFAYILCIGGRIFKYNSSINKYERKSLALAGKVVFMNIDGNLEYIAVAGFVGGPIIVYSYETGRKAYKLGSPQYFYHLTLFLPGNIFVAFRKYECCLDVFNFPQENESRNITFSKCLEKFGPVNAMTRRCPNMIYICEKNRIYLISI